jgi:hypothetical protein
MAGAATAALTGLVSVGIFETESVDAGAVPDPEREPVAGL